MEALLYNLTMEDSRPILASNSDISTADITATDSASMLGSMSGSENVFAPLQSHSAADFLNYMAQQEPRTADTAPVQAGLEEMMMNFRNNGSGTVFNDSESNQQDFYLGSRAESLASMSRNGWSEGSATRQKDQMATFDFLVKSISAANNYVSMLTREQLTVLQSLRPSLLYEFLSEVAKVRGDKRMRRALPNECAFCKNNGENEECYMNHALKDWRGRVLCPVLRAFRCPRCGATGDNAHTIKYCRENTDNERSMNLPSRRRDPPSLSLSGPGSCPTSPPPSSPAAPASAAAPPPSPSQGLFHSVWSPFS